MGRGGRSSDQRPISAQKVSNERELRLRAQGFRPYVKKALVWAKVMLDDRVLAAPQGDLQGRAGDYLVTDGAGRRWPVAAGIFETTYDWVATPPDERSDLGSEGFRPAKKIVPVWARRLAQPTLVATLEGERAAEVGDWLAVGVQDERWPIPADFFANNYEPAD